MHPQQPIERIFDIVSRRRRGRPDDVLLAHRPRDDAGWVRLSAAEAFDRIDRVSAGLLDAGVRQGDRVALLSTSRPEWNFVDLGAQRIGAVIVPLYARMGKENHRHILQQTEPAALFVEDDELLDRILAAARPLVPEQRLFTFDHSDASSNPPLDAWPAAADDALDRIRAASRKVRGDDIATIIYTSGTTGAPKGVPLTHANLLANIEACSDIVPVGHRHRALSFLPLNHVFERMMNYLYMHLGLAIYYARRVDTIGDDLRDVAPHIFTTVPHLLEKVWEKIAARGDELEGWKGRLFDWAVGVADDYELQGKGLLYAARLAIARRLVLERWHEAIGGEVIAIVSGGAALGADLNRRLTAAGIDILEGYGLTETSPVLTVNRYDKSERRFGSVGKPLHNVEIRIADDGEVLCRGPNVTAGYYRDEQATAEAFDAEGWFRTGDLGRFEDGFLFLEDRKKAVFKTSGGEYVAPGPVENLLDDAPLIEHAALIGNDRKMVTALIQPAFDNLAEWCRDRGLNGDDPEKAIDLPEVREHFEQIVARANERLDHPSRIKRFELVADEWSAETGELTPTLKVRRQVVLEKYSDLVERMYRD